MSLQGQKYAAEKFQHIAETKIKTVEKLYGSGNAQKNKRLLINDTSAPLIQCLKMISLNFKFKTAYPDYFISLNNDTKFGGIGTTFDYSYI